MSDLVHLQAALEHLDAAVSELGKLNLFIANKFGVRQFVKAVNDLNRSDIVDVIDEITRWKIYFLDAESKDHA